MSTAFICFTAVVACLGMIAVGVVLRRIGHIPRETDAVIFRLCVNVLMPCLILDNILYTHAFDNRQNLYLPPLAALVMVLVGIAAALAVGRWLPAWLTGLTTPRGARTFAVSLGIFNYGFVPIPIVETMFAGADKAAECSSMLAVLFVQNLGVEIAIWTVGLLLLTGGWQRGAWKRVINGPTLAIVFGVSLNLICRSDVLPAFFVSDILPLFEFLKKTIHYLGAASIPISVVLVGTSIADMFDAKRLRLQWRTTLRVAFWSVLLRNVALPPVFLLLAFWLPCSREMKCILVIHGAMASAIFTTVIARHYDGDPEVAFDAVASNTLVGVITAPCWIALGWIALGLT